MQGCVIVGDRPDVTVLVAAAHGAVKCYRTRDLVVLCGVVVGLGFEIDNIGKSAGSLKPALVQTSPETDEVHAFCFSFFKPRTGKTAGIR